MLSRDLTTPLSITEQQLTPRAPIVRSKEPVDTELVEEIRAVSAGIIGGKISEEASVKIFNALEKGMSLEVASMYAGITPGAFKRYLEDGMSEASSYTEEDYKNGLMPSEKACFAMECMKRKAKAVVDLGTDFYDKCFETGNTHLMMWWMERLDSNFHLKKKIQQDTDVNIGGHAVVEFKFVSPQTERPQEELKVYDAQLSELNEKWNSNA